MPLRTYGTTCQCGGVSSYNVSKLCAQSSSSSSSVVSVGNSSGSVEGLVSDRVPAVELAATLLTHLSAPPKHLC